MKRCIPPALATALAALALTASPALAGSDGCSGASCQEENAPAQVVPALPTPVTPGAPLAARQRNAVAPKRHARRVQRRNVVLAQRTAPRGAVQAGEGGTSSGSNAGVLLGIAGVLAFGGAAAYALRRRMNA